MIQQPPAWIKGSNAYLSFTSSAEFKDFSHVNVDGKVVDRANYGVREGSTIVTFKPAFIETLSVGQHPVEIVSRTGTAYGVIKIKAETTQETQPDDTTPETGESGGIYLWSSFILLASGGLLLALRKKKSRQRD